MRQDQDRAEEAIDCYRRAIDHDRNCMAARQSLGYLLANRGDPEGAREQFDELRRMSPTPLNRLLVASVLPVVYESVDDVARWRVADRGAPTNRARRPAG